ncbi:MAG: SIMPL domain-containing protein [Sarcina sp.]
MKLIKVRDSGSIRRAPDVMIILFKKIAINKNYEKAIEELTEAIELIKKKLKNIGINEDEIKTNNLEIFMENRYDGNLKETIFSNYKAEYTMEIKLNYDNEMLNKVLTILSNNIFSGNINIDFKISEEEGLKEEAIIRAVENARNKGRIIAQSLNLKIIAIEEVIYNENTNNILRAMDNNILLAKSDNINFNIIPKDIEIKEEVTVWFSIK